MDTKSRAYKWEWSLVTLDQQNCGARDSWGERTKVDKVRKMT